MCHRRVVKCDEAVLCRTWMEKPLVMSPSRMTQAPCMHQNLNVGKYDAEVTWSGQRQAEALCKAESPDAHSNRGFGLIEFVNGQSVFWPKVLLSHGRQGSFFRSTKGVTRTDRGRGVGPSVFEQVSRLDNVSFRLVFMHFGTAFGCDMLIVWFIFY